MLPDYYIFHCKPGKHLADPIILIAIDYVVKYLVTLNEAPS